MSKQILQAIATIRQRLDEIEKEVASLPDDKPKFDLGEIVKRKRQFNDWLDVNGFPKLERVRKGLLEVDILLQQGLTIEQIKLHRQIRNRKVIKDCIDDFIAKRTKG